jgi:mRNA-degrading endonuclease toxin of MazEF toxin-antitoxin module
MVTHVAVTPKDCGIIKDSTILCEQISVVDKSLVKKRLGEIRNKEKLAEFNKKLLISIGIEK